MFDLIIRNGTIVESDRMFQGAVCVRNGVIEAVVHGDIDLEAKEIVDAQGKLILPGAIDSHAHLNDPGYTWREDYTHGTAAAAVGGITTIVDMPLQNEPAMTNCDVMDVKLKVANENSYVDYAFWGGLTDYNFADLESMDKKGCVAFKSFIGPVSPDYVSLTYGQAREAMQILAPLGARAGFHCEDYSIIKWGEKREQEKCNLNWQGFLDSRPIIAETVATRTIIDLAKDTGCPVHICHVSHPEAAKLIRQAQIDGYDITGETCSHYLTFTEQDVLSNGSLFKCAPPLRSPKAVEEMWEYVADGTLACVGSDHSPCALEEKSEATHGVFGAWGGISGIQSIMQVVYSEGVVKRGYDPTLLAQCLSEGPAKVFEIYGRKGAIKVGFDADIVVFDPEKEWEITPESLLYVNQISAFVGLKGKGYPVKTFVRGNLVAQDGELTGAKGSGSFITKI